MVKAALLDISEAGLRLAVPEEIPIRTFVFIDDPTLGISTNATVRHCKRNVMKYVIGVEFSGGFRLKVALGPEQ